MKERKQVNKKTIVGTVISDKMDKVVTVRWDIRKKHPVYKKYINWHKKIQARDEKNEAGIGDVVKVVESKPLSKRTSWKVTGIIEKAEKGKFSEGLHSHYVPSKDKP